jgi:gamma-glutamylcyclotransferase (GGCT)/AIG2-like uncharacterized protein YtfP
VFVYGTLLSGEGNHRLLRKARFVGKGHTQPAFELYDIGAYPAMVAEGKTAVVGEVYEVDATTLTALDRLEGAPSFYYRTPITLADGTAVETYLLRPRQVVGHPAIVSGSWRSHRKANFE